MSFNFKKGKMVAMINNMGKKKNDIVLINTETNKGYNKIELDDNSFFEPLIDTDGRSINYICGASGSGKSTVAKGLMEKFHILFPESPIYIFSRLTEDPAFEKLEKKKIITRIPITNDIIEKPIDIINDIEEYSMVLFDDIDTISDKKMMNALNNIKLQILEIGRHKNIYCIVTSHLINGTDRNSTRTMMNEMTNLIIFPKGGGSAYQQKYCLKNYLGLNNTEIDKILNAENTRWVLISKTYPQYVLTQKICYLI